MMETGERKLGPATCRIRQTNAVPVSIRSKVRELASLQTPENEQGKGHATRLMQKVCAEADASGIVLVLWPMPWGDSPPLSMEQLIDWYERFGFEKIQPEPVLMARPVGAQPRFKLMTATAKAAMESVH